MTRGQRFEANLARAERHRQAAKKATESISIALRKLLEDDAVNIEYQPSDGWVVLFNNDHNASVSAIDFDMLMAMDRNGAHDYLMQRSI